MKNKKMHEFTLPNQAKPLCLKFGLKSHAIMASGDNKNNISLWRLNKTIPLATLTPRQAANDQTVKEVTSVCIALNQVEVYSGNNVGSFSVWNIQNQQLKLEYKEHSSIVSCIVPSPVINPDNLIITGSHDSTVKKWDLRQKASVATYDEHKMTIRCIDFTPDGNLFVTGSDDCTLKLWDFRTGKCLQTFTQHKAPISAAKFNPEEITLATSSVDGTLNYWDLESYKLMYQANIDSHGAQQIAFTNNGEHFFAASKDYLRIWQVDSNALSLMHSIESKWDSIQDLVIQTSSKTPTPTNALIGAVLGNTTFELWGNAFGDLKANKTEPLSIFSKINMEESKAQQEDQGPEEEEEEIPVDMLQPKVMGRFSSRPLEHFSDVVSYERPEQNVQDQKPCQAAEEEEEEIDQAQERENQDAPDSKDENEEPQAAIEGDGHQEDYDGPKMEENLQFNELLESTKDVRASIIHMEKLNPAQFDLSSYLGGISGADHKNQLDAIGEISKEHAKFEANMIQRAINIRQISSTWKTERALKTIPNIEKLSGNDSPLILSLITISVIAHKVEKLPLELVCALLKKIPILIETNFDLYIKVGLGFAFTVLEAFDKEIVPRRVAHTPKKVGQPKGEIPRKYLKLIDAFEWLNQQEALKKLSAKNDAPMGKFAKKAIGDFGTFLAKANGGNKPKK